MIITIDLLGEYSILDDINEYGIIIILDVVLVAFIILNPEP